MSKRTETGIAEFVVESITEESTGSQTQQEFEKLRAIESAAKMWLEEIAGCSAGWQSELVVEAILDGCGPKGKKR